jgi:hypothetical protein
MIDDKIKKYSHVIMLLDSCYRLSNLKQSIKY